MDTKLTTDFIPKTAQQVIKEEMDKSEDAGKEFGKECSEYLEDRMRQAYLYAAKVKMEGIPLEEAIKLADVEIDKLKAMGEDMVRKGVTCPSVINDEMNEMPADKTAVELHPGERPVFVVREFSGKCPTEEGYYLFSCQEVPEPELVFITSLKHHGGIACVFSDGMWRCVVEFHYNLTEPKWKKVDHTKIQIEDRIQLTEKEIHKFEKSGTSLDEVRVEKEKEEIRFIETSDKELQKEIRLNRIGLKEKEDFSL